MVAARVGYDRSMGVAPRDETADNVLVVDDDTAIGRVLVALLEQRGYAAVHVASAEEAVPPRRTQNDTVRDHRLDHNTMFKTTL